MKEEYKLRQEMYHNLNKPDDDIKEEPWLFCLDSNDQLVNDITEYMTVPVEKLLYPSKSYAVALIYAKLLHKYFGIRVLTSLKDPELLFKNDSFFVPYKVGVSADIYKRVIFLPIKPELPQVAKTINYFRQEFYLYPNQFFNNSNLINRGILEEDLEWEPHTI